MSASLTVTGGPVPVVNGIRRPDTTSGKAAPRNSWWPRQETLAYVPGPAALASQGDALSLALFNRKGDAQPLKAPPAVDRPVGSRRRNFRRAALVRHDGKPSPAAGTVDREVTPVEREDLAQVLTLGHAHQRGIGEIHR